MLLEVILLTPFIKINVNLIHRIDPIPIPQKPVNLVTQ